jgi:hypothetical protein
MALTLSVAQNKFADNLTAVDFKTDVETWFATLTVTHVYAVEIEHLSGFWVIVIIYD